MLYYIKRSLRIDGIGRLYLGKKICRYYENNVGKFFFFKFCQIFFFVQFTFLYATCIPFGIIMSVGTLIIYYWIDKYNLLRRRTVKESLSMQVSIEMIEMLELSIIFFAMGNITFQLQLFGSIDKLAVIQIIIAFLYSLLPMQEINESIFEINN